MLCHLLLNLYIKATSAICRKKKNLITNCHINSIQSTPHVPYWREDVSELKGAADETRLFILVMGFGEVYSLPLCPSCLLFESPSGWLNWWSRRNRRWGHGRKIVTLMMTLLSFRSTTRWLTMKVLSRVQFSPVQSQLLLLYSPAASAGCRLQFDCVGDTREQQQHLMAVGFDINCPYHESNVKPECPLLLWFIFDSNFMFNRLDFNLPNLRNTWHEMLNWTEEEGREWTLV